MTITLRPEHERLIIDAMQTGAYRNPEEVIGRALEILHSENEWLQDQKELVEEKLAIASRQFERGEYLSAEDSRAQMEKRKAEWLADNGR